MEAAGYNTDMTLRAAGYRIWSRPAQGVARWEDRDGNVLPEWEALEYAKFALGAYAEELPAYQKPRKERKPV